MTASSIICAPALDTDKVEVFGVVPDGITELAVKREDDSVVTIKPSGNVYTYVASRSEPRPLEITWRVNGEAHAVEANVPADFRAERCAGPDTPGPVGTAERRAPEARDTEQLLRELKANR